MSLGLEEAAVLLGLLDLLADPMTRSSPEVDVLLRRWQGRLGTRLAEAMGDDRSA